MGLEVPLLLEGTLLALAHGAVVGPDVGRVPPLWPSGCPRLRLVRNGLAGRRIEPGVRLSLRRSPRLLVDVAIRDRRSGLWLVGARGMVPSLGRPIALVWRERRLRRADRPVLIA